MTRFWTQFEAWLSFQIIITEGPDAGSLKSSDKRCVIEPMYNANKIFATYLRDMWAKKTPQQAFDFLSKPDVTVTNQSDKDNQLPKIQKLDETVKIMQLELKGKAGRQDLELETNKLSVIWVINED